jgi:hypothetical protein
MPTRKTTKSHANPLVPELKKQIIKLQKENAKLKSENFTLLSELKILRKEHSQCNKAPYDVLLSSLHNTSKKK